MRTRSHYREIRNNRAAFVSAALRTASDAPSSRASVSLIRVSILTWSGTPSVRIYCPFRGSVPTVYHSTWECSAPQGVPAIPNPTSSSWESALLSLRRQEQQDEPEEPEKTLTADGEAAADLPDDAPQPRLCHMTKWRDFEGYGFNLHAEKDRRGQYVGKIDEGSPAEYAGLREGDRIVEVNGVNVQQEAHRDIVERIRAVPDETRLLVLTADGEQWYRDRDIQVHGNQANVLRLRNPELNPATNGESRGDGAMAAAADGSECSQEDEAAQSAPTPVLRRQSDLDGKEDTEEEESRSSESEPVPAKTEVSAREEPNGTGDKAAEGPVTGLTQVDSGSESKPAPGTEPAPAEPANAMSNGSLNMLNMSASEMRQLLAQRKKHDPKKIQMDLKKKYELIEQM
ncbi:hypothetical protein HPB51_003827 [Rhipicephalus microplus]|uniref:PDZ domain-containing protein n=1 Tax=Rhipicephalus microplus TaxID=6941 RepID=A0A9J6EKW8_RHIMP|nr:hypothetical protein HPB51_003827 [Rhipicephalus microplus]